MDKTLLEITGFVMEVPIETLEKDTSASTCNNWTQSRLLTLISNCEIEFGIEKFTQKEIDQIHTLGDLELRLIDKKAFAKTANSETEERFLTENDLVRMIAQTLLVDPSTIKKKSRKEKIPEWDSMGVISIMAMLEDEFQLTLSVEEAVALNGMPDLIALLRRHNKLV